MKRKVKKKTNSPDVKVKSFKGGLSVYLTSREEMENWVNVFDKRYYDHLGQDPEYGNLLVQWEAENGNAPILTNEDKLDPEANKQLTMSIYFKVCDNSYRKIFSAIFYLQGKKHCVMMGGTAAQCWFDEEMSTIKSLADLNKKDSTSPKVLKKSKAEPFPEKLVSDPGCKTKLIKIEVMDDESDGIGEKGTKADTEDSGDPEISDVTSEDSGDEEIETSGDEWGAEHIQTEKAVADATIMIEEEEEEKEKEHEKTVPLPQRSYKGRAKRGKKEDGHNEKNEENKTRKQLPKAPSSDIVKERDALKKRVLELERKVERLEYETHSLADEKEMLKRAYKSEKREREYLEEVLDKLDEEKDAKEAKEKSKEKEPSKKEKEAEKSWSQMSQYDMQLQTEKEAIRELEKEAELAKLREYQQHLRAKIVSQPQYQQQQQTQYQQRIQNQQNQFYQQQPMQTPLPNNQYIPSEMQNFGKRECRYEKQRKGSCRWGKDCKFFHNIGWSGENTDEEKDKWRASGLCFAHMAGACTRPDCRFLHPEKERCQNTEYLQQPNVTNLIKQCIKDSMDSVKKEILRDIQYNQQQQVPQHPRVSWDPNLV